MVSNAVVDDDDSISIIATGFTAGHFLIDTYIMVTVGPQEDCGALTFEIGTASNCARDGTGGTKADNAAEGPANSRDLDTGECIRGALNADGNNTHAFTSSNIALCIAAAKGGTALTTACDVTFVATVMSATTAALPSISSTDVAGHTLS